MMQAIPARAIILVVALAVLIATGLPADNSSINQVAFGFGATWLLCLIVLVRSPKGGIFRASVVYLVVFGLFHGGLVVQLAVRGPSALLDDDSNWIYGGQLPEAIRLCTLGMVAFTLGVELGAGRRALSPPEVGADSTVNAVGRTGVAALLLGAILFALTLVQAGGPGLISGGYETFLEDAGNDTPLSYGTTLIAMGSVLAVAAGGRARLIGWLTYLAYAAVAFPLGTRGTVLFPLMAMLVVECRRGRRPSWRSTVSGSLAVLVLIGIVRETRTAGFAVVASENVLAAPLSAIAEMGYSLRPTVAILDWQAEGNPYADGVTLVAVPLRLAERLAGVTSSEPDERLFNVKIQDLEGPIGGSPIAEAYYNFGEWGVPFLMSGFGLFIGVLERRRRTMIADAALGALLFPLVVQVRNSFASVPADIGLALLLVLLVHIQLALVRQTRHREHPQHRASA
jgi:O-antigen polysaccharide polymerase Wzy